MERPLGILEDILDDKTMEIIRLITAFGSKAWNSPVSSLLIFLTHLPLPPHLTCPLIPPAPHHVHFLMSRDCQVAAGPGEAMWEDTSGECLLLLKLATVQYRSIPPCLPRGRLGSWNC